MQLPRRNLQLSGIAIEELHSRYVHLALPSVCLPELSELTGAALRCRGNVPGLRNGRSADAPRLVHLEGPDIGGGVLVLRPNGEVLDGMLVVVRMAVMRMTRAT